MNLTFSFHLQSFCHFLFTTFLIALINYLRPVFVFRSDRDSRRKTVEEIKRRAQSEGEWPQVTYVAMHMKPYSTCTQGNTLAHTNWELKGDSVNTVSKTQMHLLLCVDVNEWWELENRNR